jgi:outer membrane protein TolC
MRIIFAFIAFHSYFALADPGETPRAPLTKSALVKLIKTNSPQWAMIQTTRAQGKALQGQAEAATNPQIFFVAREMAARINQIQFGFENTGDLHYITVGSSSVETLYGLYDRFSAKRVETAEANMGYVNANARVKESDLIYYSLLTYLNAQRLKRKLEIHDINLRRDAEILSFAQAKVSSGAGLKIDLMRAHSLRRIEEVKKLETSNTLSKTEQDLSAFAGQKISASELEPMATESANLPLPPQQVLSSQVKNLDLQAAEAGARLAAAFKDQQEQENGLKVAVFSNFGVLGTHVVGGFGSAITGSLGVQLQFSIFDGGLTKSRVEEAASKVQLAQLQLTLTRSEFESKQRLALDQIACR